MLLVSCWHRLICIIYKASHANFNVQWKSVSLSESGIVIILLWLLRDCLAFSFSKTTIAILCVKAKGCWVKQ